MTTEEIRILSDVSKYDEQTRQALTTAIEVAYAATKRGVLPNEADYCRWCNGPCQRTGPIYDEDID